MPNHGLTFTPRGRGGWALDGTGGVRSRYLPFSDHTLSNVQKFQRFLDLSPFFSYSCALFCTLLHSSKLNHLCSSNSVLSANERGFVVTSTPYSPDRLELSTAS